MAYYLRKENKKKGIYLQMYESHWDKEKRQPRSKSVMAFGYVQDIISDEIPDPIAYYTDFVAEKNKERAAVFAEDTRPHAFSAPVEYNLGHFLIHTLLEELNVKEVIDILAAQMRFQFRIYDMIVQLIFSRIIYPFSKSKTVSSVFPHLYNSSPISEEQVYDGLSFIGGSYKKYIELFNHCYEQHYQRDFSNVFSTVRITILRLTFHMKINRKGLPKKTAMILLSVRRFSWMQIWCLLPCRCTLVMSLKNLTSKKSLKK